MSSRSLISVAVLPKSRWYVKAKTRSGLIVPTDQIGVAKMFRVSLIGLVSCCAKDDEGRCEGRIGALVWALSKALPFQSRHALLTSPAWRDKKKPPRSRRVAAFADSFAVANTRLVIFIYSLPLLGAPVCVLQVARSLSGFAPPALSAAQPWSAFRFLAG